jgi:transcriptional regulator with XRE-family HTH domain
MDKGIGDRLRSRAKELQLSDAEVARRLGLAQSRYAHYVSGSRSPDYQTLARICRVLLTSPDYLLGFSVETAERPPEQALLQDRVAAALGEMDLRSLRLAADMLDLIARQPRDGDEPI